MKDTLKYSIKTVLGRLCVYKIREKPVFIFSTRRSGSTLLMNMIYSQPGIDYMDQPLDLWQYHPHRRRIPALPQSQFISLESNDEKQLLDYFSDLLSGRLRLRHQWNVLDSRFSFAVKRLVIKELNSKNLMDWLESRFDMRVVYLIRHPVPTAMSIIQRGWGNSAEAFLKNALFRRSFLDDEKEAFCEHIMNAGTRIEKFVLEWILENLYPLRVCQKRSWMTLTYEEIASRPQRMSELICSVLELPDPVLMHKTSLRPTKTSLQSSAADVRMEGPQYMIRRWMDRINPGELENIAKTLDFFGIEAYNVKSPFPEDSLCHLGPLEES